MRGIIVLLLMTSSVLYDLNAQNRSIKDLDLLIGRWSVEEIFMKGTPDESKEQGERICYYILDSAYICCETKSKTAKNKERKYQFLINYNKESDQFEMVSIYSDWHLKRMDAIRPSKDGKIWEVIGQPTHEKGVERRIWGTIEFNGKDEFTWIGKRNTSRQRPDEWTEIFIELSTRLQ